MVNLSYLRTVTQFADFGLNRLQIFKGFGSFLNVAQQRCRVIDGSHLNAAAGKPLTVFRSDLKILFDDGFGGNAAPSAPYTSPAPSPSQFEELLDGDEDLPF